VDRLIEKGYAVKYDTWEDVTNAFGGVLVSKLACIVKEKEDGTLKVRNVLDLRRSGYNEVVKLQERIVLPRVQDLIGDARDLKRSTREGELCYGMVADFEDAFHTLYVDPSEWRYLVARHPEQGFVGYRTVLCGARAAHCCGDEQRHSSGAADRPCSGRQSCARRSTWTTLRR
jgi:hypothetical protein